MPISVQCTGCKSSLKVRDDLAGRKVKCPKCANVLRVPAAEEEADMEVVPDQRVSADPPPRTKPRRHDEDDDRPRRKESIRADRDEDDRPRRKEGGRRDRDEDDRRDEPDKKRSKWKECPQCGATGAKRVMWTAWGSFYGPAMFNHVRCPECSCAYNGKTGGSNMLPAVIFVVVPLLAILGIIGGVGYVVAQRMGYLK